MCVVRDWYITKHRPCSIITLFLYTYLPSIILIKTLHSISIIQKSKYHQNTTAGNRWILKSQLPGAAAAGSACGIMWDYKETKRKFFRTDFALLCHDYDIRFDAATESPASAEIDKDKDNSNSNKANTPNVATWTQERLKRRTSYGSVDVSRGIKKLWIHRALGAIILY